MLLLTRFIQLFGHDDDFLEDRLFKGYRQIKIENHLQLGDGLVVFALLNQELDDLVLRLGNG